MKNLKQIIFIGIFSVICFTFAKAEETIPQKEDSQIELKQGIQSDTEKKETFVSDEKSKSVEPEKTVQEVPVKEQPAAKKSEIQPEKTPKSEMKQEEKREVKLEMTGYVAPLKDIIPFYEKEIVSMKKMIDRWNTRANLSLQRESDLAAEIASLNKNINSKKESDAKKFKKEIKSLNVQLETLLKQQKQLKRDLVKESQELAIELDSVGKQTQMSMRNLFLQTQNNLRAFYKE